MSLSLLFMAVMLALVASPHCATMCGCGLARRWLVPMQGQRSDFLLARFAGLTVAGAVVGGASEGLVNLAAGQMVVLSALHWVLIAIMAFSAVVVLVRAKPLAVEQGLFAADLQAGRRVLFQSGLQQKGGVAGSLWWMMPCGVLYSAYALAYLGASAVNGAAVLAAFAVVSSGSLAVSGQVQKWVRQRWSEQAMLRANGAFILFGIALMVARELNWLPTPQWMAQLGLCL